MTEASADILFFLLLLGCGHCNCCPDGDSWSQEPVRSPASSTSALTFPSWRASVLILWSWPLLANVISLPSFMVQVTDWDWEDDTSKLFWMHCFCAGNPGSWNIPGLSLLVLGGLLWCAQVASLNSDPNADLLLCFFILAAWYLETSFLKAVLRFCSVWEPQRWCSAMVYEMSAAATGTLVLLTTVFSLHPLVSPS